MNKNIIKSMVLYLGITGISGAITHSLAYEIKNNKITTNNYISEDQMVDIPDENLKKRINNALGRGQTLDDITISDMESLKSLHLSSANISSIEGLQYAVNITNLRLDYNKISDISPLKNLTKLSHLNLRSNKITDISYLESLTNMRNIDLSYNNITSIEILKNFNLSGTLNLEWNKISDMSSLENLTGLTTIQLNNNQLSDVSSLQNLTGLTDLRLSNNQISDVSSLQNLTKLTHLRLSNNQISDISVLQNLTTLTTLNLGGNQISDISALENLVKLTNLSLYSNEISDISNLKNLTKLTNLELYSNQISNISGLENLTSLTTLNLRENQISDISSLENLTKLTDLRLNSNQISDISSLSNLTNLNYLSLINNQIIDISPLKNNGSITTLLLENNQISSLPPLDKLTKLVELRLYNNKISDISGVKNLINLKYLELYNNQISDISDLKNLNNLTRLYLSANQISDISVLENLTKLTNLDLSNQKITIDHTFKTKIELTNINVDNPIKNLNGEGIGMSTISNGGYYKNNRIYWNNVALGQNKFTSNFSQAVQINTAKTTFSGTITYNIDVIDGEGPLVDKDFSVNKDNLSINATITAEDLLSGVDYLMHKGQRQSLPYTFEYDVYNRENNIIEVYDTAGNMTTHEVTADSLNLETISSLIILLESNDNSPERIAYIRTIINSMSETENKTLLSEKINNLSFDMELKRQTVSSNIDIYIKCENMLLISLDTNSITFDDFSGVKDMEKTNAVNITVNSSLPYQINAYLPTEIQNSDGSNVMDKQILNIKESSESDYQTFTNATDKIILKDNCISGNDIQHSIDLMLKGGIAHEKDVYKTTIKFEVEQK